MAKHRTLFNAREYSPDLIDATIIALAANTSSPPPLMDDSDAFSPNDEEESVARSTSRASWFLTSAFIFFTDAYKNNSKERFSLTSLSDEPSR